MRLHFFLLSALLSWICAWSQVSPPTQGSDGSTIVELSSLDIQKATTGWGTIKRNKSVDGNPITLRGTTYTSGVGLHAQSRMIVKLGGAVTRFHTFLGIDDEVIQGCGNNAANGNVRYRITLQAQDGSQYVAAEGQAKFSDSTVPEIDVDCNGWKYLLLDVLEGEGGNAYDHFDWADAWFEFQEFSASPPQVVGEEELASPLACATEVFAQPGIRFMQHIRATDPQSKVSVEGLPDGLVWNAARSCIDGRVEQEGDYQYTALVESAEGETRSEPITLHVSRSLQQPTPFMGWLSWNVVQGDISDDVVRRAADAMVSTGLRDAGYRYLVMDDLWHARSRAVDGRPQYDSAKFPNGMNAVADYVHSKGLKFGIYSDAGDRTCAGCFGSYGHEQQDAQQYASWGVDLLKYDYCFAPTDAEAAKTRYQAMGDALRASGRDILFYMCEWGVREPWKWGASTGATTWRCTYDTRDGWNGLSQNGEIGIGVKQSVAGMKDLWPYAGPNRFNDADMMCIGIHGTGKASSKCVEKAGMTQTEYQTQMSLWCLWASPLTLSFDMTKPITDDDLRIMTNAEMIAVNQDRLGMQAMLISDQNSVQVYMKDLENGDVAVGVVNMAASSRRAKVKLSSLPALTPGSTYDLRDLWQHEHTATLSAEDELSVSLAAHETKVYRLSLNTGISAAKTEASEFSVKASASRDSVRVSLTGASGNTRVLLSDLAGRVLSQATTSADDITLPRAGTVGPVVVSAISGGIARSVVCQ